ncbi:hypothetical protein MRY87_06190 [bacterium]|nr:hypothetical protein [bacterium]
MGTKKRSKISLEEALCRFLSQLDSQVARDMQRSPEREELEGVQKWEPYRKRVERVTALVLEGFGEAEVNLDSLLISAEAFMRALRILTEELGEDGLGTVRSGYVREICKAVERDLLLTKETLIGCGDEILN